jgi:ChrB-like protein
MGAPVRFVLVVYRMPTKPTAGRVAVWRQLKKIGAIYLHQSVCVFPDTARTRRELEPILGRIENAAGEYHLLPLRQLTEEEHEKLVAQFVAQTGRQYEEIVENCEVNFQKEIEFETFRKNFTYEEAEEIRIEFDKICSWFAQVRERDWFGAPNQGEAKEWLGRCEKQLEEFEARVYEVQQRREEAAGPAAPRARRTRRRGRVIAIPQYARGRAEEAEPEPAATTNQ